MLIKRIQSVKALASKLLLVTAADANVSRAILKSVSLVPWLSCSVSCAVISSTLAPVIKRKLKPK
ncbi:hypothetical protein D3C81_2198650 [compost metagenome]